VVRRKLFFALPFAFASAAALLDATAARADVFASAAAARLDTTAARADDPVPDDLPRWIFDTGRVEPQPAEPGLIRVQAHGEEQLRFVHMQSLQLDPTASYVLTHPGVTASSLGQNDFVSHWLRLTPTLQLGDKVTIVGQMDLTGILLGEVTHDVRADQTPRADYDGYSNLQPRWLYVDWRSPIGRLRVGQQPSHWAMGLVANDGDHPPLFGDPRYGTIVEQVLLETRPFGPATPFVVAAAGNLVFRDPTAILTRGDHAWQGTLAAFYERGADMLGLYGVYRHQSTDRSTASVSSYSDDVDVSTLDVAGSVARPLLLPGQTAFVFGSFEAAANVGWTSAERSLDQAASGRRTMIRGYGGAAAAGVVLVDRLPSPPDGVAAAATTRAGADARGVASRPEAYGRFVAQIEAGYASGDADPYDDVEQRFVFDPNHRVGLLLFDEVMRWQTARASVALQDPNLSNAQRVQAGAVLLPSNGGIFGAEYVYPTAIFRPRPWLDLKLGAVFAQTTADVIDPYRLLTQGASANYRGGDPRRHDLGVELDGGVEARLPLPKGLRVQLGAQAGFLSPGGALADAQGAGMKAPWITIGRAGLQF
jgi:hypothetical protein